MLAHREAALGGHLVLSLLDLGVEELLDPAALQADQVGVVVARSLNGILTAACTLASNTSRAKVDLPEPDTPVTATSRCSGT